MIQTSNTITPPISLPYEPTLSNLNSFGISAGRYLYELNPNANRTIRITRCFLRIRNSYKLLFRFTCRYTINFYFNYFVTDILMPLLKELIRNFILHTK